MVIILEFGSQLKYFVVLFNKKNIEKNNTVLEKGSTVCGIRSGTYWFPEYEYGY